MNESELDRWIDMKTVVNGAVYEFDTADYRITVALADETEYTAARDRKVQTATIRIARYIKRVEPPKGKAK